MSFVEFFSLSIDQQRQQRCPSRDAFSGLHFPKAPSAHRRCRLSQSNTSWIESQQLSAILFRKYGFSGLTSVLRLFQSATVGSSPRLHAALIDRLIRSLLRRRRRVSVVCTRTPEISVQFLSLLSRFSTGLCLQRSSSGISRSNQLHRTRCFPRLKWKHVSSEQPRGLLQPTGDDANRKFLYCWHSYFQYW